EMGLDRVFSCPQASWNEWFSPMGGTRCCLKRAWCSLDRQNEEATVAGVTPEPRVSSQYGEASGFGVSAEHVMVKGRHDRNVESPEGAPRGLIQARYVAAAGLAVPVAVQQVLDRV